VSLTISNYDNFFGLLLLSIPCLGFLHIIAVEHGIQMEDHFFYTICSKEKFASSLAEKKENINPSLKI